MTWYKQEVISSSSSQAVSGVLAQGDAAKQWDRAGKVGYVHAMATERAIDAAHSEFGEWFLETTSQLQLRYTEAQSALTGIWQLLKPGAPAITAPPVLLTGNLYDVPAREVQADLQLVTDPVWVGPENSTAIPMTGAPPEPSGPSAAPLPILANRYQRSLYLTLCFGLVRDAPWVTPLFTPPSFAQSQGNWLKYGLQGGPQPWLAPAAAWVAQWQESSSYALFAGLNPAVVGGLLDQPPGRDLADANTNDGPIQMNWQVFAVRYLALELVRRRPDVDIDAALGVFRSLSPALGGTWLGL